MTENVLDELIHHVDLPSAELIEIAVARGEGILSANKALSVETGTRTGRSPKDRFIVYDDKTKEYVNWNEINQPCSPEAFARLWEKAQQYVNNKEHFVAHLRVGADDTHFIPVEVITELAWHNLFANILFIHDKTSFSANQQSLWTVLSVPGLKTNPELDGTNSDATLMINFSERKVLLCGLLYAGEMKKAMFSVLNFILPEKDILPMHCAANIGQNNDVALFFGLSGTGKTTLSSDPHRFLIGDDEHGWSNQGIFNFEGGCYAKCIDLSREREPLIWNAIHSGAVMENVVLDPVTLNPDYGDVSLTQNSRAAYPREHIQPRAEHNFAGHPSAVIFLSCDLYGVLPPVAKLTKEQAAYYFLSGYTALVGSTEVGQKEAIKITFSTCFGAPFFPRPPSVYAGLLLKRLNESEAPVYMVNTGWTGGSYGEGGKRFSIPTTRHIIETILTQGINDADCEVFPGFHFLIPKHMSGIDAKLLNPVHNWDDSNEFSNKAKELISKFIENFNKFAVAPAIKNAGPTLNGI